MSNIYTMSFEDYLTAQKLAKHTIKIHLRNLDRYDIIGKTQQKMIEQIDAQSTLSMKQSVSATFSKYLQYKKQPNDLILKYMNNVKSKLMVESAERHKSMAEDTSLPNTKDLTKRMNELYDKEEWRGFCIMYLMLTYQVRNMDMMAEVVKSIKDTNDTDNWFVVGKSQVKWIRNKYKTASVYGQKIHTIKNKKFMNAISKLDALLTPKDNVDRVMKKITGGLTEGIIAKIVLRDNDTLNGLNKMSKNRGTDLKTINSHYNITLPDAEEENDE